MRRALNGRFPALERIHLTDFKVRVLDGGDATGAVVRVLIDSTDGDAVWTTMGVDTNIIEASWQALHRLVRVRPAAHLGLGSGAMAAPEYVPHPPHEKARVYSSPPWGGDEWLADRPAELDAGQPLGPRLGYPGPDQGFAMTLAEPFAERLVLTPGERVEDAVAGCTGVALKRASLFGRAPMVHDLTSAFTIWGFLATADAELVRLRKPLFDEVANVHHYMERRKIADLVPQAVLRLRHDEIAKVAAQDWRAFFKRRSSAESATAKPGATPDRPAPPAAAGASAAPGAAH